MYRDRNALIAGLFILFTTVAIVIVIVLIRGEGTGKMITRKVAFRLTDDLDGLSVGDEVRLGGVKVGTVHDISFTNLNDAMPGVIVTFSIPSDYALHNDAKMGVQATITGPANLNITSLGHGAMLAENDAVPGEGDPKSVLLASLGAIVPKADATVDAFKETAQSATHLVKHVDDKVNPVVEQYNGVAGRTGEAMAEVRDLVGDSKPDFRGTVHNLNVATGTIRSRLPTLLDKLNGVVDKVDGALASARVALEDVEKTAANAKDISASARSVVVDNHSRFDAIVKSLKTTSDNLKETSVEVRHSPWRLLYKPTADEMGNLNLYDSARQFADGAGNLSDAAEALRDAMRDPNVDKEQLQKLIGHLDETFKHFHAAEDKLWTSVKQ